MLKKATFLLFFILCQTANCQIKISGVIVDNNGLPIQGASVTIKSIENNSSLGYTFSVKDGIFDISIPSKTQNAIIKVTHLGYKAFSKVFVIQDRYTKLDNIIITQNTSKLNEVILKAEKRRIQKGDTTVFKVDKYINGTEENLKDVLDKIEGFDINNQGKITINGKQIDRLLVDGENLYKNQHSFATDNIPASLVGDLELIKNYSDFDALKTKEKSGITALNVKIKDEKKNRVNGAIEIGGGVIDKYRFSPTLLQFSKKTKTSLISKFNNTGESPITIQDYFDLTTPPQSSNGINSSVTISSVEDTPRFLQIQEKVKQRSINFSTLSTIINPNKKIKVDVYGIFNHANQTEKAESTTILISPTDNAALVESNIINENNYFGVFHVNTVIKHDDDTITSLKSNVEYEVSKQDLFTENNFNNASGVIFEKKKPKYINSNSLLTFKKRINDSYFEPYLFYIYSNKRTPLFISSNSPFLNLAINDDNQVILKQQIDITKIDAGTGFKYGFHLKNHKISFYSLLKVSKDDFKSQITPSQYKTNKMEIETLTGVSGIETTLAITKKIFLTLDLNYNNHEIEYLNAKDRVGYFGGKTSFRSVFNNNHIATLQYGYTNADTEIEALQENSYVLNYRTLQSNNNVLPSTYLPSHRLNLNYFKFNTAKKMTLIFDANYNFSNRNFSTNISNLENSTVSQTGVNDGKTTFRSFIFLDKKLSEIPFSLTNSISYDYFEDTFLENTQKRSIVKNAVTGLFSITSQFKKSTLSISGGLNYSFENYSVGSNDTKQNVYQPFFVLGDKITPNIFYKLKTTYTNYITLDNQRSVFDLSPQLRYNVKNSNWEFKLTGRNVLNLNSPEITTSNVALGSTQQRITSILEGNIILSLKYKF